MRRYLIPLIAFLLGSSLIAGVYFGILTWAQGWQSALSIFLPNRWYVIPIWISFGIQASLYSILRFQLFLPTISRASTGAVIGTSGGTSVTTMVACCLHHVTDVLPILGVSAVATFLTRYQRPFMLIGLGMNIIGILAMIRILYRERKKTGTYSKITTFFGDYMKRLLLALLLIFILVACAPSQVSPVQPTLQPDPVSDVVSTPTDNPALLPTLFPNAGGNSDLMRMDEQGMVVFEVTPINLGTPADTLEFNVAMNTHSVNLSMDLATLATLTTDTGATVQATKWDAVPGGHHVSGKLIFPAMQDSKSILAGTSKLTLTVVNVDAASRVFEWELK